jgi:hypothetical protein
MSARVSFSALNGGGGRTLDAPVAALAGLSVAFLAFAIPADLLAELVGSIGLDNVIPAAAPPLGAKARIGLGGAGAIAVFAVAFLVLRWLDRFGAKPRRAVDEAMADLEPPRLRRRDVHPDAPARAPLLATYDLGEPEAAHTPPDPDPAPAPAASPAPADTSPPVEPRPDTDVRPEAVAPAAMWTDEAEPTLEPFAEGRSIADLMARLEQGLARRRTHVAPSDPMVAEPSPEPSDERLQSAIENLQRLASRQP